MGKSHEGKWYGHGSRYVVHLERYIFSQFPPFLQNITELIPLNKFTGAPLKDLRFADRGGGA